METASGAAGKRAAAPDTGASPGEFLKHIKNKPVVVKLNSGVDYRGARRAARRLVESAQQTPRASLSMSPPYPLPSHS